ncbi:MAG: hypothetical protein JNL21_00620 [Myxococcales bacterium]|nr:hypothetical protein [Myxococcales bacterium]
MSLLGGAVLILLLVLAPVALLTKDLPSLALNLLKGVSGALAAVGLPLLVLMGWGDWAQSRQRDLFPNKRFAEISLRRGWTGATLEVEEGRHPSGATLHARFRWGIPPRRHCVEMSGPARSQASFYVNPDVELANQDITSFGMEVRELVRRVSKESRGIAHVAAHEGKLRLSISGWAKPERLLAVARGTWHRLEALVGPPPPRPMVGYREAPELVAEVGPELLHRILRTLVLESGWGPAHRHCRQRQEDRSLVERMAAVSASVEERS